MIYDLRFTNRMPGVKCHASGYHAPRFTFHAHELQPNNKMKTPFKTAALLLLLLSTINYQLSTFAQGTAFTYQGRLFTLPRLDIQNQCVSTHFVQ